MKYISMFSGIEAASAAVHDMGWTPVAFSEIEPFPCSVLAHHYPHVPNLGDMTKVDWSKYHGTVDLVCGGSPCQAFSIAGLRQSLDDDRGNLTLEFMRACHAIKPRWILWENVPGVFSAAGNPFGCFLAGLAGYDTAIEPVGGKWSSSGFLRAKDEEGYNVAWRVLDAQHFGVPQRRQRIFVVASLGKDWWAPCEVLFEREGKDGHSETRGKEGKEATGYVGKSVEGEVFGIRGNHIGRKPENGGNATEPMYNLIPALTATDQHAVACAPRSPDGCARVFKNGIVETLNTAQGGQRTPCVCHGIIDRAAFNQGENALYEPKTEKTDVSPTIVARGPHAYFYDRQSNCEYKSPTDLVTAFKVRCGKEGGGKGYLGSTDKTFTISTTHDQDVHYGTVVRRLTPTECERLQGFPDGWTDVPHRGKPAADAPRYKALGNSWAVPCARWIFERIQCADGDF